ncbi:hypothetical protein AAP_03426 [Ascosphaera apis ARSEF 7405]|uniref:Uncharacterized protein n=1 Tax=Ascosphaera apis ARSEF 7405 TaxID=392613 RepID=A0A167YF00_9EURO|nr:hypothetical protein AAP_03426 [Ascosphaera apis ARSEF 7405]
MTASPARKRGKNAILALLSKQENSDVTIASSVLPSKRARSESLDACNDDVERSHTDQDESDLELAAPLPFEQSTSSGDEDDSEEESSSDDVDEHGHQRMDAKPMHSLQVSRPAQDCRASKLSRESAVLRASSRSSHGRHIRRRHDAQDNHPHDRQAMMKSFYGGHCVLGDTKIMLNEASTLDSHLPSTLSSAKPGAHTASKDTAPNYAAPKAVQLLSLLRKMPVQARGSDNQSHHAAQG